MSVERCGRGKEVCEGREVRVLEKREWVVSVGSTGSVEKRGSVVWKKRGEKRVGNYLPE